MASDMPMFALQKPEPGDTTAKAEYRVMRKNRMCKPFQVKSNRPTYTAQESAPGPKTMKVGAKRSKLSENTN